MCCLADAGPFQPVEGLVMHSAPHTFVTHAGRTPISLLALSALVLVHTATANAADFAAPMTAAAFSQVLSWTGFYIGADAGYAWGKDTTTEYLTANNTFTGFDPTYRVSSAVGGLYAGYNYQIGLAVLGVESDIEAANLTGGFLDTTVGGSGTTQLDWQGSLRGRAGFTTGRTMFYGTGGLAFAQIDHTYTNLISGVAETNSGLRIGWTAGGGIEFALMPNVLARVEYRYTDYGPYRYNSVTAFPGFSGVQEPRFSAVRAGVAYKF
jgi:outer membrane immunogenic protein